MKLTIDKVTIHTVRLPFKAPFTTSFGTVKERDQILLQIEGEGLSGWGESAVLPFPFYNPETPTTAMFILKDYAIPILFKTEPESPERFANELDIIVGHRIGRSGLEMACWDWTAKSLGIPLYKHIGGTRNKIPVGVSLGITKTINELIGQIGGYLEKKYHKIKVKIAPGFDLDVVKKIISTFPDCPLMVDANSAYTLSDVGLFQALDEFSLMMIEQPLREDDMVDHAKLQARIKNPICLDESVEHVHDAKAAFELGSCRIINIKPGRVGGITETKRIHDLAQSQGFGVWCGGMLETGIGRAMNMAIATLPNFKYPGDISESTRYYHEDIVQPEIKLTLDGKLQLLESPGIGFEIDQKALAKYTVRREVFLKNDYR